MGVIVFFTIGIVAIFIFLTHWSAKERTRRAEVLSRIAYKLGGNVVAGSFWKQPELHYEHLGLSARLEYYSTGGKHPTYYTRLYFYLPATPDSLHIYPERFFSKLGKLLGGQDIQVDDIQFDEKFIIKGNNPTRVRKFLSPQVRQAIFELRVLNMNDHVEISIQKNVLRIQKLSWLKAYDLINVYISLGHRVVDGLLGAEDNASKEISSPVPSPQRCPVCTHLVGENKQICSRCKTAHHPECFQLNDGCGHCRPAL